MCGSAKLVGAGRRMVMGSLKMVMGYLQKDELPGVVALAWRALPGDKNLLAAHYLPARKSKRRAP